MWIWSKANLVPGRVITSVPVHSFEVGHYWMPGCVVSVLNVSTIPNVNVSGYSIILYHTACHTVYHNVLYFNISQSRGSKYRTLGYVALNATWFKSCKYMISLTIQIKLLTQNVESNPGPKIIPTIRSLMAGRGVGEFLLAQSGK